MPAKIKILGPDNIWKYKDVPGGFFTYYVTSSLYPVLIVESMSGSGSITDTRTDYHTDTDEELGAYGFISSISIETTDPIFPEPYTDWPAEELSTYGLITNVLKETTDPVFPHPYALTEEIRAYGFLSNVLKEETGGGTPILYTNWPAESLQASGFIVSVLKERSEEHTSELQCRENLVCRLPLEKKKE